MNQIQDLILYEDNHLLVVHKPAGILSQRDETNDPDMLTMLKQYLKSSIRNRNVYLGLVHRRTKRPGVMVFAKPLRLLLGFLRLLEIALSKSIIMPW